MRLEHRLDRLEAASGASAHRPCPACGATPREPERFVLLPIDLDDRPTPGPNSPDSCPRCGRRLRCQLGAITLDEAG